MDGVSLVPTCARVSAKRWDFAGLWDFCGIENAPQARLPGGVLDFIRNAGFDVVAVVGGLLYDLAEGA